MNNFDLIQADTIQEVVNSSENERSRLIAGGTNLIDLMKYRVENPTVLIDINKLDLSGIKNGQNGQLILGALSTNAETAYHKEVEQRYPLLSKAILSGASTQLRNMATNGGNLMQRTRCYYFYDTTTPCNKREPGSGCSALEGFNRIHAILGTSAQCIATHPSDMCVALAALNAKITVEGKEGKRQISILDFHRLPGDTPKKDTNLKADEIITGIELPKKGFSQNFAYLKVRDRPSYAFALISVACGMELEGSSIKELRVAVGGVAHKPWRLPKVEEKFKDKSATKEVFTEIAEGLMEGAQGFGHNDFKIELAKKTIVRALIEARDR